jgi:hypothetical protein
MGLIEFGGYILPDWMVYSFFILIGIVAIVGVVLVRRRLSNPDEIHFNVWEYLPSGIIPKTWVLAPDQVGPSHYILKEGESERHVMHSHPWVIPGTNLAIFTMPFGSNKADNPEEMFHKNRNVRTPFPLVDAQTDALGRIQNKSGSGFGLRKNLFTILIIFALGLLSGIAYMSYAHHIPIGG